MVVGAARNDVEADPLTVKDADHGWGEVCLAAVDNPSLRVAGGEGMHDAVGPVVERVLVKYVDRRAVLPSQVAHGAATDGHLAAGSSRSRIWPKHRGSSSLRAM